MAMDKPLLSSQSSYGAVPVGGFNVPPAPYPPAAGGPYPPAAGGPYPPQAGGYPPQAAGPYPPQAGPPGYQGAPGAPGPFPPQAGVAPSAPNVEDAPMEGEKMRGGGTR